mmetsp:Transcript_20308/g.24880  ORF Transcript_20308/g.24880 Transcript_20308/m.24880 type:complete len:200 (-) Transcript_20308:156-755(-)
MFGDGGSSLEPSHFFIVSEGHVDRALRWFRASRTTVVAVANANIQEAFECRQDPDEVVFVIDGAPSPHHILLINDTLERRMGPFLGVGGRHHVQMRTQHDRVERRIAPLPRQQQAVPFGGVRVCVRAQRSRLQVLEAEGELGLQILVENTELGIVGVVMCIRGRFIVRDGGNSKRSAQQSTQSGGSFGILFHIRVGSNE